MKWYPGIGIPAVSIDILKKDEHELVLKCKKKLDFQGFPSEINSITGLTIVQIDLHTISLKPNNFFKGQKNKVILAGIRQIELLFIS